MKASKPGAGPFSTISWKASLFFCCGRFRYSLPILQYIHQHPFTAPCSPNRSSNAGHLSGVRGRIVRSSLEFLYRYISVSLFHLSQD